MKLNGKRILLVEDNPDQQRLYLKFLLDEGADVTLECNGFSAAQVAHRARLAGEAFDATIMDLYLYQCDGVDATRAILQDDPSMPIVAITAHGSAEIESTWRQAGASEYLSKPIPRTLFVQTVADVVGKERSERPDNVGIGNA